MSTAKTEALIKINGNQDVPVTAQQIMSITVSKEINKIPTARIVLKDGQANEQDFNFSNQDFFKPGTPVEILLGAPQQKSTVFKGIIIKHGLKIKKDKPSVLVIECKDEAVRLSIGRKSRYWNEKSDSEIFKEIIDEYEQLSVVAEDSSSVVIHNQIVQYYASDWDFMAMRSEAISQYMFVDDGKLNINKPKLSDFPVFNLSYGESGDTGQQSRIWEFESDMDARHQFESINTMGWDYSKQELSIGSTEFTAPSEPGNISSDELNGVINLEAYHLHHLARMDENELSAFADAVKQKSILHKSRGRIKIDGRADIKPGNIVGLNGVGERFNGNVFVSRVHHSFEPGRWFTEILYGLPFNWFHEELHIANPPAQGLLPAIKGLQIAKVIQLKDDENPDKDFRIKVGVPGFHKNDEGIWARYAAFFAGNQSGAVFLPELNDEVVIGYIGEDSREPIILGALYSEANVPPLDNDDNNYLKGIITKNKHQIVIDEEKNIMSLMTPGKNQVVLNDEKGEILINDNNKNTITLNKSGITLESFSDININAKGSIILNGKQVVSLIGTSGVEINSPTGTVKLGAGISPVASFADVIASPAGPGTIGPTINSTVLV